MPELPEVETLKRELALKIKGQTIESAWTDWPKIIRPLSVATFKKKIKGRRIAGVGRRAKIIILTLDNGELILIHLKLTGQLIFSARDKKNKFTHLILNFKGGRRLFFNDLRKFGWLKLTDQKQADKIFAAFGPEPLDPKFTAKKFASIAGRYPNRKIKQILLDQKLIAGVGNIYTDESCFCAGILPTRPVKKIKPAEWQKLFTCLRKILKLAIRKKGTSADTYVRLSGEPGGFLPYLKVYGRKGRKCRRCGGEIKRIKLAGRGTHFCPKCQK